MPAKGSGAGVYVDQDGYVRVTRRGPDRGKLQHRVVMAEMCREFCYWGLNGDGLPEGMEVHHQDMRRDHNCQSNLLLLDAALHLHMDRNQRSERDRMADGTFGIQPAAPVGSVVEYLVVKCRDCARETMLMVGWRDPDTDAPDWVTGEMA